MGYQRAGGLAAAIVLGAMAASAAAAEPTVTIGARARVTAPSVSAGCVEGTLAAVDSETLTIVSEDDDRRVEVPRSRITKLEVVKGKKSRWAIGALVGAGAGVLLGVVASNPPSSADQFQIDGGAVAVCGAVGAAGGALVGAVLRTDRWTSVPADTVTLSIGPVPGPGIALAMRVSF